MLDEDAEESLNGTKYGSVDHDGAVASAIGSDIGEVETLGHGEVGLDCSALPGAVEAVADMEVDFWSVKCSVAGIHSVFNVF